MFPENASHPEYPFLLLPSAWLHKPCSLKVLGQPYMQRTRLINSDVWPHVFIRTIATAVAEGEGQTVDRPTFE